MLKKEGNYLTFEVLSSLKQSKYEYKGLGCNQGPLQVICN